MTDIELAERITRIINYDYCDSNYPQPTRGEYNQSARTELFMDLLVELADDCAGVSPKIRTVLDFYCADTPKE